MRKKSSARFDSENVRHVAEAAFADATARSISSIEANCTSPACSPVAGLYTGPVRPDAPATGSPPIQCPITFSSVVTAALICAPPASVARSRKRTAVERSGIPGREPSDGNDEALEVARVVREDLDPVLG